MLINFKKLTNEIKNTIKTIYSNYKNSNSLLRFILTYLVAIGLIIIYFSYFCICFLPIFVGVSLLGLKKLYFNRTKFELYDIKSYQYNTNSTIINIFKYYSFDIIIQYSYLIFYICLQTILKNKYALVLKNIISRLSYYVFIWVFGFPIFFLKLINKLYIRMNNSFSTKYNCSMFMLNLESMFIIDYEKTIKFEKYCIYWKNMNLIFNPPKFAKHVIELYDKFKDIGLLADYAYQKENLSNYVLIKDIVDKKSHRCGILNYGIDHNGENLYLQTNLTSNRMINYDKKIHILSNEKHENYESNCLVDESYLTPFENRKLTVDQLVKKDIRTFSKNDIRDIAQILFPTKITDDITLSDNVTICIDKADSKKIQLLLLSKQYSLLKNIIMKAESKGTIIFEPVKEIEKITKTLKEKLTISQLDAIKWLGLANSLADLKKIPIKEMKANLKIIKYYDFQYIEDNKELLEQFNDNCKEIEQLVKFLEIMN